MYSNCSDITEDTIELEITRAEAEYTKETKKIQVVSYFSEALKNKLLFVSMSLFKLVVFKGGIGVQVGFST